MNLPLAAGVVAIWLGIGLSIEENYSQEIKPCWLSRASIILLLLGGFALCALGMFG
jgi:hypothetical protein